MTLPALRDDALSLTSHGFELRLGLPWIRSLPLSSLDGLEVTVDGERVEPLQIVVGDRLVDPDAVAHESGWWFLQDRLVLRGDRMLQPGAHDVAASFRLRIPYLQAGPDGPLTLPFLVERTLDPDAAPAGRGTRRASRDPDAAPAGRGARSASRDPDEA
ncbi:MAG TPA: DUF6379 domain-containing protein, partial [Agromyces sp.]|nr:DUF6379 domain-containing protein [Agromyces sp.]